MHCSRHNSMSLFWIVGLWVIALVVARISHWWYQWSNPKSNGKLPPGSMGFPIIGETFGYFKPHGFYELSPILKKKMLRSDFNSVSFIFLLSLSLSHLTDMKSCMFVEVFQVRSFVSDKHSWGKNRGLDGYGCEHGYFTAWEQVF